MSGTGGAGGSTDWIGWTPSGGSTGEFGTGLEASAPDVQCGGSVVTATSKKVNILLVVDKSGSMKTTPAGFTADKWTALKTALSASLDQVKGGISFGLELYPMSVNPTNPIPDPCPSARCCEMPSGPPSIVVPISIGTTSVPQILTALNNNPPAGGTPTAVALQDALDYFTYVAREGENYVLLATDGAPNCNGTLTCDATHCTNNIEATAANCTALNNCCASPNQIGCVDDAKTLALITALKAKGISTFVVGIPGTELYATLLDSFAVAGGMPASPTPPQYYAVSASGGVSALTDVFSSITKRLIKSCDLQLASDPPDATLLNVSVDGVFVSQAGADGWDVDTTTSPPTIRLKGATCKNIQTNGANSLEVIYGCPTYSVS